MTSEGLKAFATYFLSQRDRGLEKDPEQVPGYLDGYISKFGVGATQAVCFTTVFVLALEKFKSEILQWHI